MLVNNFRILRNTYDYVSYYISLSFKCDTLTFLGNLLNTVIILNIDYSKSMTSNFV